MRAALVEEIGQPPVVGETDEPARRSGQALVEVKAAAINPIDISISTGRFYGGAPQTPYVMGREAVGHVLEGDTLAPGTRVWFQPSEGGTFAERALADESRAVVLPDGSDDARAASLGIAGLTGWLAVEWRAQLRAGERVLVLGATGVVGMVAVQAARALGAARTVAAGRDSKALEAARAAGADALVELRGDSDPQDLAGGFRAAADGEIDVVVDPLWGQPAAAAIAACARHARIVQLGQSAGAEATLRSGDIRGKSLDIRGFTLFHVPHEQIKRAYGRLLTDVKVDHEALPLDSVAEAWSRQQDSPHRKLVLVP